jgi:hypothetical protein
MYMKMENITMNITPYTVPELIFIVPYRDRVQQRHFFNRQMEYILEDIDQNQYEIYFIHQCDDHNFNRGAMKNVGFIGMKQKYPDDYKDITFIFNDIDTMPYTKNFINYETTLGVVKHFYGFNNTLGGIVSIKGIDFEKTNGFPNFISGGYEDNIFHDRVLLHKLHIDRSQFYPIKDKDMLYLSNSDSPVVNKNKNICLKNIIPDGIVNIKDLIYEVKPELCEISVSNFKTNVDINKKTRPKSKMSMLL